MRAGTTQSERKGTMSRVFVNALDTRAFLNGLVFLIYNQNCFVLHFLRLNSNARLVQPNKDVNDNIAKLEISNQNTVNKCFVVVVKLSKIAKTTSIS